MADRYQGLPPKLKQAVFVRDNWRCRWCGATNAYGYDVHHIQYRRGYSYDVIENLVTLCRRCHDFVHDSFLIPKPVAQEVLGRLIADDGGGLTGLAVWRILLKESEAEDKGVRLIRETGPVGRLLGDVESDGLGSSSG